MVLVVDADCVQDAVPELGVNVSLYFLKLFVAFDVSDVDTLYDFLVVLLENWAELLLKDFPNFIAEQLLSFLYYF